MIMRKTILIIISLLTIVISCSKKQENKVVKKIEPKVVTYITHYVDSSASSSGCKYTKLYISRFYKAKVENKYFKKLFSTYGKYNMQYNFGSIYTCTGFDTDKDDVSSLERLPLMEKMIERSNIPFSEYAFIHRYKIYSPNTGETTTYVDLVYTDKTKTKYIEAKDWVLKTE
jgi:hypothetical protein